jgi:hypothetical protein
VWKRAVDGRPLTFRLAGINNQNFLMRDEETGSFWQQISGKAVSGPYQGRQLEFVHSDEVSFGLWRSENPSGTVLSPVGEFASKYERKDWEVRIGRAPTVVDTKSTPYKPRDLMLGVEYNNAARAYPLARLLEQKLIQDFIGGAPVIVVVGPDAKSVRVFDARVRDQPVAPDYYRDADADKADAARPILMDSGGSRWNFQGCAVSGPSTGQCLRPVQALKDYWFDWQVYHPKTTVYDK